MAAVGIVYVIYAVVLLLGGAMGYAKAKSLPSLVAGVASAALMLIAFFMLQQGHARWGLLLGAVVSFVLGLIFLRRFLATRQIMPAILMLLLSDIIAGISVVELRQL